jgi:phage regulator Rha-like protein
MKELIPVERIENKILLIRGDKVMLDVDLAELYNVEVKHLVRAVRRNIERFPSEFMFQLDNKEFMELRSHFGTAKFKMRRFAPLVFTEQGVAMLSSVLNSKRAIQINIEIMKTFVRMREMLISNRAMAKRLDELESKYDKQFDVVFDAIRQLMAPPPVPTKGKIGFPADSL